MLALDLDPARGDVDYQGAELVQLLGRHRRRARARRGSGGTRGQPFEVTWHGRMVAPGTDIGRVIQRVITRFFTAGSEPLKVLHRSRGRSDKPVDCWVVGTCTGAD
jgi:hypothetical protein